MRLLLADDHQLLRDTIAMFLKAEGFGEVASVSTLDEALSAVESDEPFDLVLLDYRMPGMDGLDGLQKMIASTKGRPVALLSGEVSTATIIEAIKAGAAGFVPKSLGARAMVSALHLMSSGEIFVPYGLVQKSEFKASDGLTERETEVLRGLSQGKANKEIARDLGLQEVTVKLHVKTLCRKLNARNRTQAAIAAKQRGLV